MRAKDIMTTPVVTVTANAPVADIARTLIRHRISAIPVVDDRGRIVGIVSEGDLMRRPESGTERKPSWWLSLLAGPEDQAATYVKTHGLHAGDVMTRDVVTIQENSPLAEIATLLESRHIKRVPVVKGGKPVGIVSRANLLHGLVVREGKRAPAASDAAIRQAIIDALGEAGIEAGSISVTVTGGSAQFWGAVESDAEKQAVRVAAERTPGVKAIENNVAVLSLGFQKGSWA